MLKHPHCGHSHASVVKYPCSDRASLCARVRGLVVTVKPLQRRISDSPHRSGDCPTTTRCGASLTVLKHPHCGHSHASVVKYALSDRVSPKTRERGRLVTVFSLRCEMRASPLQTAHCPTTVWCRARCGMLKHPPPGRMTAHKAFDMFSNWTCHPQLERGRTLL